MVSVRDLAIQSDFPNLFHALFPCWHILQTNKQKTVTKQNKTIDRKRKEVLAEFQAGGN